MSMSKALQALILSVAFLWGAAPAQAVYLPVN